jgi:hypothetical protein
MLRNVPALTCLPMWICMGSLNKIPMLPFHRKSIALQVILVLSLLAVSIHLSPFFYVLVMLIVILVWRGKPIAFGYRSKRNHYSVWLCRGVVIWGFWVVSATTAKMITGLHLLVLGSDPTVPVPANPGIMRVENPNFLLKPLVPKLFFFLLFLRYICFYI